MSAWSFARPARALVAGSALLLAATLWVAPADADNADDVARRANANPTGTAAGSPPNRLGNLKVSLAPTADGRIKVTWVRDGRPSQFRKFVVQVSPSRTMSTKVQSYRASRRAQVKVVPHAFGATRTSGNYSFVRVRAFRTNGAGGSSPTKWIQAPLGSPCAAAANDRVTVAAFNIRTWGADSSDPNLSWNHRGPNVISEILRSGARALAIQEASGRPDGGFGPKTQGEWVLDRLNADDPDNNAKWVDALTAGDYQPPPGRTPGHVGTRVFYDSNKYTELGAGLKRITDPGSDKDSLIPWARLQDVSGTQAPFVITSNHLTLGAPRSLADWKTRGRQADETIAFAHKLYTDYGNQVIVAGDLNSTANTLPYNNVQLAFMKAGFYDTFASADLVGSQYPSTSESKFPLYRTPLRRDYILSYGPAKGGCGYRNQTYNRPADIASDHFLQRSVVPLPAL